MVEVQRRDSSPTDEHRKSCVNEAEFIWALKGWAELKQWWWLEGSRRKAEGEDIDSSKRKISDEMNEKKQVSKSSGSLPLPDVTISLFFNSNQHKCSSVDFRGGSCANSLAWAEIISPSLPGSLPDHWAKAHASHFHQRALCSIYSSCSGEGWARNLLRTGTSVSDMFCREFRTHSSSL